MIDNLNYTHFTELSRLFYEQGLSLEATQPLFSLIPTATEVGKASLIAGRGDQIDLPTDRYADLVQAEWKPVLHGKQAAYLANIGELQTLDQLLHQVYFLNYLPVDQTLHQDVKDTGKPHMDAVRDCLSTLAATVGEFARHFQIENRLLVYVVSDHGSTRIARGVVNVLDKDFYKGIAVDKHHRYLALSDEQMAKLPQVVEAQCYVIKREKFKTNHNYLAARQYYRFLETDEGFYVHGGLTPEEVVVPFARFSLAPVIPETPTIRLLSREFRYAVQSRIPLEIGNPNPSPVESVVVRLIDADGDEAFLDNLPGKQKHGLEISTRFRKLSGAGATRDLTVRLRYEYQGRLFAPPDFTFEITMKTMMEVTDDFDL